MRKTALTLIGGLLSALALYLVLRSVDLGGTLSLIAQADVVPLAAVLPVLAAQVILRAFRWRLLLRPYASGRLVSLRRLVPVLLIGYLGNAILPARLGEAIRAGMISRRERVPFPESLGTALLERIIDVATLAVIVLAASVLVGAPAWMVQVALVGAGVATLVLLVLGLTDASVITRLLGRLPWVGRHPRAAAVGRRMEQFLAAVGASRRPSTLAIAAGISSLAWALDATTFWLVAQALHVNVTPGMALLIAGVTVLGTAVPSAPGYVGTFELAASATATALGVPADGALAVALVAHAATLLPLAIGGAISLGIVGVGLGDVARGADERLLPLRP